MIIYFDCEDKIIESQRRDRIDLLYMELMRCSRLGNHLVFLTRRSIDWGLENLSLSDIDKAQLLTLRSTVVQVQGFVVSAQVKLEIVVGFGVLQRIEGGGFKIGCEQFIDGRYCDEVSVVLENKLYDGAFYDLIFRRLSRRKSINIKYTVCNGGGSDTYREFLSKINENRIVICIADHDRYAPNGMVSSTFSNIKSVDDSQEYVGDLFETICRELENHIPLRIITEMQGYTNLNGTREICELVDRQDIVGDYDCIWLYFDIKKGVKGDVLVCNANTNEAKNWVRRKYGEDFDEVNFNGFGENVMKNFLRCDRSKRSFERYMASNYWENNFQLFFENVFVYLMGSQRRST